MRNRLKTGMKVVGLICCLGSTPILRAYAGDINAAEQSVIDYCSQIFVYEGKEYVASSKYLGQLYDKLSEDGVDLSMADAQSAINQAAGNIARGVAEGYLVEVKEETGEPEEPGTSGETGEPEEPGDTEGSDDPGNPGESEEPGDSEEPGTSGETGNPGEPGTSGETETTPGTTKPGKIEIGHTEIYVQTPEGIGDNSTDVQTILKEIPEGESVTTQNFVEAEVEARVGDKIILENTLPVKNTGYDTIKFRNLLIGAAVVLSIVMTAALCQIYFAYKYDKKE